MNIQRLFRAIKEEPEQHTLLTAVAELERQGYQVTVEGKYRGSSSLEEAEARGELDHLPAGIGVVLEVSKANEKQAFRMHLLDIDAVCITDVQSPPVIYDPRFTIDEFR